MASITAYSVRAHVLALGEGVPCQQLLTAWTPRYRRRHDRAEFCVADKARGRVNDPDHLPAGVIVAPPDQPMECCGILNFRERSVVAVHRPTRARLLATGDHVRQLFLRTPSRGCKGCQLRLTPGLRVR